MNEHETQASVNDWIEESYPGASLKRKLKHAFEEMTELARSAGTDLTEDEIISVIRHSWQKSANSIPNPAGEIADVRISLIGISSKMGIDEQDALDTTMGANRERSLADRQAREAAKLTLDIFKT